MSEPNEDCAICHQPIDDYDWCVQVRRMDNFFHVKLAHHTCPRKADDE